MDLSEVNSIIREYEYINFEAPKDDKWSIYRVKKDDTIIKLKPILFKLLKRGVDDYIFNAAAAVAIFVHPEERRSPSQPPFPTTPQQMEDSLTDPDMDFEPIIEPWNAYTLDGGSTLKLRAVAMEISRTSLYDPQGEPVYLVRSHVLWKKSPML
jgi:hypothetical protein